MLALQFAERASEQRGEPVHALPNALLVNHRYEEAVSLWRENPHLITPSGPVMALVLLGHYEEALAFTRTIQKSNPGFIGWLDVMIANAALGNKKDAQDAFDQARKVVPRLTLRSNEKGWRLAYPGCDDMVDKVIQLVRDVIEE